MAHEVCSITGVDQFDGGSAYKCGFVSVAECTSIAKWGSNPTKNGAAVSLLAHNLYVEYDGEDVSTNEYGMSIPVLYDTLHEVQIHYQALPLDVATIRNYIRAGYPVIVAGAETGFYDLDLGDTVPYPWTPSGSHVVVFTGIDDNGIDFLVRDSANIIAPNTLRPGPRRYDASKLQLVSATAIGPGGWANSWLPAPTYPLPSIGVKNVSQVPDGWKDDGTTLTAPNGFVVTKGFRTKVLQGWDAANFPIENEHGMNSEEISNPSLGAGTQQLFRYAALEWTQKRGVYAMWMGIELAAQRKATNDVQALLAKAQADLAAAVAKLNAQPTQKAQVPSGLLDTLNTVAIATQGFAQVNAQVTEMIKELQ